MDATLDTIKVVVPQLLGIRLVMPLLLFIFEKVLESMTWLAS
jgi:hypothetical protein